MNLLRLKISSIFRFSHSVIDFSYWWEISTKCLIIVWLDVITSFVFKVECWCCFSYQHQISFSVFLNCVPLGFIATLHTLHVPICVFSVTWAMHLTAIHKLVGRCFDRVLSCSYLSVSIWIPKTWFECQLSICFSFWTVSPICYNWHLSNVITYNIRTTKINLRHTWRRKM